MKVAIREQIEIEDDQRVKLADILDAKQTKRQATRDEIKDFAWALGSEWAEALEARWQQLYNDASDGDETAESSPAEDLLGDGTPALRVHEENCALADDHAGDCDSLDGDEDLLGMSTEEAMEALL